jgi:nitrogen-specific signal transduction histidine kinase
MMSKKLFVLLVVLMSLSLAGIIFVQAYYINNTLKNEEKQFTFNAKKVLSFVSNRIEKREFRQHVNRIQRYMSLQKDEPDSVAIRNIIFYQLNEDSNETLVYRNGIVEENYTLPSTFFETGLDTINIKRILSERETKIFKNDFGEEISQLSDEERLVQLKRNIKRSDEIQFETLYKDFAHKTPIHNRVSVKEISNLLKRKLLEEDIDINFEFAIYSRDLATKIQSDNFELNKATYKVPIFRDNSKNDFNLLVSFPERKKFIFSSVFTMLLLSIIFTTIIIFAFYTVLSQLVKQRKIAEIKNDFINNMTHEFKTPIATINLAIDAIRNPKIIDDKEKVLRYLGMIKEENKRMHAQVENVLRISKLEKRELNISKENINLHDLIEDAITHVSLIVEDKQGYIKTHFKADNVTVLANEMHFTNVIVNILDNAIKYSPQAPKIDIYTENIANNIFFKIKDQGSGMSKAVQKRVFEKFYREQTGNIHNVKGHGLGLAYVKQILDDHQCHISIESEKEKGSTFIIKLPLIS